VSIIYAPTLIMQVLYIISVGVKTGNKATEKLVAGVTFLGGFSSVGEKTSRFFKLQKICTLKKIRLERVSIIKIC
jgi:hypothetical protein